MQTISKTLHVGTEEHRWCDEYGANANPPRVIIGTKARLIIDLRSDLRPQDDQLPPYDYSQFSGAVSWYFALDTDYDQATIPPFLKTTGISLAQDADGRTILTADLPDTDCAAVRSALATSESLQFRGEIAALDGNGDVIVCLQFPVRLVNRVFIDGEVPAEVENDPAYLTAAQVRALLSGGYDIRFSADAENWHSTQAALDRYISIRNGSLEAAEWSPPIRLPDGAPGSDGLSAYQLWLAQGNEGTVADFLASLKGDPGLQGNAGLVYVVEWPESPVSDILYVNGGTARLYHGGSYVEWAALDSNGKIPSSVIPTATAFLTGGVKVNTAYGLYILSDTLRIYAASIEEIDAKTHGFRSISPNRLNYAVRSVSPLVTEIPSATSAYSLLDATATTNNHSWHYRHAPTTVPTYTLPSVASDSNVEHLIVLVVDFTSVQACSFVDSLGASVAPLDSLDIRQGDVVEYFCKYDYLQAKWTVSARFLNRPSSAAGQAVEWLPSAMAEVILEDGGVYAHQPASLPSYVLPYIAPDDTGVHRITLYTVVVGECQGEPVPGLFYNGSLETPVGLVKYENIGFVIAPQVADPPATSPFHLYDSAKVTCEWEPLERRWLVIQEHTGLPGLNALAHWDWSIPPSYYRYLDVTVMNNGAELANDEIAGSYSCSGGTRETYSGKKNAPKRSIVFTKDKHTGDEFWAIVGTYYDEETIDELDVYGHKKTVTVSCTRIFATAPATSDPTQVVWTYVSHPSYDITVTGRNE